MAATRVQLLVAFETITTRLTYRHTHTHIHPYGGCSFCFGHPNLLQGTNLGFGNESSPLETLRAWELSLGSFQLIPKKPKGSHQVPHTGPNPAAVRIGGLSASIHIGAHPPSQHARTQLPQATVSCLGAAH